MSEQIHDFHDRSYKDLLSYPEMIRDLLTGFVNEDFIEDIDFSNIEKLGATYILEEYQKRETDLIIKLNIKGQEAYLYILIEIQSSPDKYIAMRVLQYLLSFYQDLLKQKEELPDKLPPVFPIVLYTGKKPFNCAVTLEELIDKPYRRLQKYVPKFEYYKVAINEIQDGIYGELIELENIVAACFNLVRAEKKEKTLEAFEQLVEIAKEHREYLRRAIEIWLRQFFKRKGVEIGEIPLTGGRAMIEDVIDQVYEEGKEKGIVEGIERGKLEGITEGKLQMARELLNLGFSVEKLAEITKLPLEELKKALSE
jgi:predicted transposase/invertase (TIGR01784 family)